MTSVSAVTRWWNDAITHRLTVAIAFVVAGCGLHFFGDSAFAAHGGGEAFPGAKGFGAFTAGGRGGRILRVNTLQPSGPGSLSEALQSKGPRVVVFEVGGVIDLGGRGLSVTEPFLTVAGQTAPAPGITLIKGGLHVATHDVLIQHLAVRPGEAGRAKRSGWEVDALSTVRAWNVIIDHCSFTWATDENLSASGPRFTGNDLEAWREGTSHHITFSHCIIAEGLANSTHTKGEHSKGSLIHDNATFVSLIGNLYASNVERNPLTKGGVTAVIVNNWIVNPGRQAIHAALVADEWGARAPVTSRLVVEGNVLDYGPDTQPKVALFRNSRNNPVELYLADNLAFDRKGKPLTMTNGDIVKLDARPIWPEGLTPLPAADVRTWVARNAGARPWDRDPVDQRIVQSALDRTGRIIDSEQAVGGYPHREATVKPFSASEWKLDELLPETWLAR